MTSRFWILIALAAASFPALAQRNASNIVRLPDDLVSVRQLADQGSIQAQLTVAKKYLALQYPAEALAWYLRTAEKDCLDGIYQAGHIMLFGAPSQYPEQRVPAQPLEGVKWTYRAATNGYVLAYRNMSVALERGLGVRTNLAEAYAWMKLYADTKPEMGKAILEGLGLKYPTDALVDGRKLANELKQRRWPKLRLALPQASVEVKSKPLVELHLTGITVGGRSPLAVINQRTLGTGESSKVSLDSGGTAKLTCLEIREDTVLVQVEGEDEPRWLQFDSAVGRLAGQ